MGENLNWLWAAFSVAWAFLVIYVFQISGRTKELQRQIERIREQLKDRDSA